MKLLIAEDELMTREGLLHCIPPVFTQVEAAGNGQAAYEMAVRMKPDVVLCDIRMPKMDGITLAQLLRKLMPNIHILFISGYTDKEYLKAAIALEADGYIEKPIDEKDLLRLLSRTAEQIRQRRETELNQEIIAQRADLYARQQFIHALLLDPEKIRDAFKLNKALSDELIRAGRYLAVCIYLTWIDSANTQLNDTSDQQIVESIKTYLPKSAFCAALSNNRIGIIVYGDDIPSIANLRRSMDIALGNTVRAYPRLSSVLACIGRECKDYFRLPHIYQIACAQAKWMSFTGKRSSWCSVCTDRQSPPPEDRSDQLENLLHIHDLDGAKKLVASQTDEITDLEFGSIDAVRKYYEVLLSVCLNCENITQRSSVNTIQRLEILSTFSKLRSLHELSSFILVYIDDLLPLIQLPDSASDKTQAAIDYVQRHLSDTSLSVQSTASSLGLTENYLSSLYKRETGQTLHKVIISLRLERAKHLLLQNYKLRDVAAKTGFSSANYLHSVFKKQTGLSPTDYIRANRGKYSGEENK